MRNPKRLKIAYEAICEIHEKHFPDWRLGQLWMNLEREYGDLFFYEDDKMVELINKYAEKYGRGR